MCVSWKEKDGLIKKRSSRIYSDLPLNLALVLNKRQHNVIFKDTGQPKLF